MKKANSLLEKLNTKIDQAFQTKIRAVLSGEEKSDKKSEEKPKPKKDKKNSTYTG